LDVGGDPIFIGLDTEWASDPKRKYRNTILSYGLCLLKGDRKSELFVEPNGSETCHRLSLKKLIGSVIEKAIRDKVLLEWPDAVNLVVHYGRGDLAACSDFKSLKRNIDSVKGTLATTTKLAPLAIDIDEKTGRPFDSLPAVPVRRWVKVLDRSNNQHELQVRFIDTYALAAAGASLDALGKELGISKLTLPDGYDPTDMRRFKADHPDLFRAYNLVDAWIAAAYAQRFAKLCRDEFGLDPVPPTLGGFAVAAVLKMWAATGIDRRLDFGMTSVKRCYYNKASNRQVTQTETVPIFARSLIDQAAAGAYHGGRTETFVTGPIAAAELRDIDLRSAYPSAMSAIGMPEFSKLRLSVEPSDFRAETLGFAEIVFETPEGVRFPVFGVRTEHGLIFPRRGVTIATAPEIAAGLALGVGVTIRYGVVVPWDRSVRPFELFVVRMLRLREKLKGADGKDTLESKMIKTATNSVYGKVAQAVRPRSAFDTRSGGTRPLVPSAISNPILAAFTTGLVRASIAEMLNSIPANRVIVSVSTDGFLTSASRDEIRLDGPATRVLVEARHRIADQTEAGLQSDHDELLEVKKTTGEVIAFRNRGIATTAPLAGSDPILARGGVKVARGTDANQFMMKLYLDRTYETVVERRDLISLRDQMIKNADLVSVLRQLRVNLDPDMKRRLVNPRVATVQSGEFAGREHLATESVAFDSVEDALGQRLLFESWRHGGKRVLKTMTDWQDWEDYRASRVARKRAGGGIRITRGGSAEVLKRQFLSALVRDTWGLSLAGRPHKEIAGWLTQHGYPTTVNQVKNATRPPAQPQVGVVAASPAALDLLRVILAEHPGFEIEMAFAPDDAVAIRAQLALPAAEVNSPSGADPTGACPVRNEKEVTD
jgi:hypothetical protein